MLTVVSGNICQIGTVVSGGSTNVTIQLDGSSTAAPANNYSEGSFFNTGDRVVVIQIGSQLYIIGTNNVNYSVPVTDWNTARTTGFYYGTSAANGPLGGTGTWSGVVVATSANYTVQTVTAQAQANNARYTYERVYQAGTWTGWRQTVGSDVPLTLVGASGSGSSFGTGITSYPTSYAALTYQKVSGICSLNGLVVTSAAVTTGGVICTLPTTMLPVFSGSSKTFYMICESVSSTANTQLRFYINTSGQIIYNAPVSGQTIVATNNFNLMGMWIAAT